MERITAEHRKKAFCMLSAIVAHCGYEDKATFYADTIKPMYNNATDGNFSLSEKTCTVEEYDLFMGFLLELAFSLGVQFDRNPKEFFHDTEKYLIMCVKNRVCCITGQPGADRHHTIAIKMGNNREDCNHSLFPRMALCREKHTEAHTIGQTAFDQKYHVYGVYCVCDDDDGPIDEEELPKDTIYQNIKKIAYSAEKGLLGVRFNRHVPGCNKDNLIYYRMTPKEYHFHKNAIDPLKHFTEEVYGKCETVEM